MIPFKEAYRLILDESRDFGKEKIPLQEAVGRVLAEDIFADRDFPPFDRATRDGIVLNHQAVEKGRTAFEIDGVLAAGHAAAVLRHEDLCMEIMTGAVIPYDADTVVMYENCSIDHGIARLDGIPKKGQHIHRRGSDRKKGDMVLKAGRRIATADIGILASVGASVIPVKKLPRIAVISTGDELVEIDEFPMPHQLRKSNIYQLYAALREENIIPLLLHVSDDEDIIRQKLSYAIDQMDVLLLSGGVSRGKFDFIPKVMDELGLEKIFHKVLQRPGKPFWFGKQGQSGTLVFSFPGNPVSTYVCYYRYFRDWLHRSIGLPIKDFHVILSETFMVQGDLTGFIDVKTKWERGCLMASRVDGNGSGDLTSLAEADGFVCLEPRDEPYYGGNAVPFIPTRKLV